MQIKEKLLNLESAEIIAKQVNLYYQKKNVKLLKDLDITNTELKKISKQINNFLDFIGNGGSDELWKGLPC